MAYSSAIWVRRAVAAAIWICLCRLCGLSIAGLGCTVRVAAVLLVVLRHDGCLAQRGTELVSDHPSGAEGRCGSYGNPGLTERTADDSFTDVD
jgi:hypothetical protein